MSILIALLAFKVKGIELVAFIGQYLENTVSGIRSLQPSNKKRCPKLGWMLVK